MRSVSVMMGRPLLPLISRPAAARPRRPRARRHISSVRGTRDILPGATGDSELWSWSTGRVAAVAERYGFGQVSTPIVEHTEVFQRTLGDDSDVVSKEMFTFPDLSGKSLSLRPENTAGVVRALLAAPGGLSAGGGQQHKLYYAGPMFRYERPQRGRYRQFHQFGVEVVGGGPSGAHPMVDADTICLGADCLDALGLLGQCRLEINTLGDADSRAAYHAALKDYFEGYRAAGGLSKDSLARLDRGSVLRILDSKHSDDTEAVSGAPPITDYLTPAAADRHAAVLEGLDAAFASRRGQHGDGDGSTVSASSPSYVINPRLVRGLDYYCHTAFEFVTDISAAGAGDDDTSPQNKKQNNKNKNKAGASDDAAAATAAGREVAVLAGGRYDGLSALMGGPAAVPAFGWAAGLERLCLLLQAKADQGHYDDERLPPWIATRPATVAVLPVVPKGSELESALVRATLDVASALRRGGVVTHSPDFGALRMKKQMKAADKLGAAAAVLVGADEAAAGKVTIKNMRTGEQDVVAVGKAVEAVREMLAR
eukprot:g4145.t1